MGMGPMAGEGPMTREQAVSLSRGWWALLAVGILSVVAGIFVLAYPWTIASVAIFLGVLLILRGLAQLLAPSPSGSARSWNVVVGVLGLLVGIGVLVWPAATLLVIATFIGAWLVVSGAFHIAASIARRRVAHYWGLGLLGGIVAVLLGIVALSRPTLTLSVLVAVIGIWAIIIGITEIVASFEVRRLPRIVEERRAMTVVEAERIAALRDRGAISEQEYEEIVHPQGRQ